MHLHAWTRARAPRVHLIVLWHTVRGNHCVAAGRVIRLPRASERPQAPWRRAPRVFPTVPRTPGHAHDVVVHTLHPTSLTGASPTC